MRHLALPTIFIATLATLSLSAQDQPTPANESRGLPPRASPSDYQAHGEAGSITIAAEFKGHAIPTSKLLLNSEDYVSVELALYGPPGARTKLSIDDFSLRINGAKKPLPSQSDVLVFHSVRDPEWEPEVKVEKGGKTSIGGGGRGQEAGAPPPLPPKPPIELQRSWSQTVQKAALAEGDRALPQAGLIFFKYGGKTKGIRSLELIYEGPAGKATVALEP